MFYLRKKNMVFFRLEKGFIVLKWWNLCRYFHRFIARNCYMLMFKRFFSIKSRPSNRHCYLKTKKQRRNHTRNYWVHIDKSFPRCCLLLTKLFRGSHISRCAPRLFSEPDFTSKKVFYQALFSYVHIRYITINF